MEQVQIIAGSVAGFIFAAGNWNMVVKAWRTKDVRSYSLSQLILNMVGSAFYWLYVLSLPFGPIYYMHGFFTLVSLLMLVCYLVYTPRHTRMLPALKVRHLLFSANVGVR